MANEQTKQEICELMLTNNTPACHKQWKQNDCLTESCCWIFLKMYPTIWHMKTINVTKFHADAMSGCWENSYGKFKLPKIRVRKLTKSPLNRNLSSDFLENVSHHMAYEDKQCDKISGSCDEWLLRKLLLKIQASKNRVGKLTKSSLNRKLSTDFPENVSHHMAYEDKQCDKISGNCDEWLLRKLLQKFCYGRTHGRTDRGKTVYPPLLQSAGIIKTIYPTIFVDLI